MSKNVQAKEEKPVNPGLFGTAFYQGKPKQKPSFTSTKCGDGIIIRAALSFSKEGTKMAAPGEKLDLDAMIQAAIPQTDIAAIVARAKMGDDSVLHLNPGFVGDSTQLPKDIYDYKAMNDLYDKVSGSFEKLPADLQALFNNDASVYLNSIISNQAEKIIQDYNAKQQKPEDQPQEGGNQ